MATDSTRCYVSHLDDITKLIVWRGRAGRNGLHMGVSPCCQYKVFNFTFVDTSSNSKVAILAPLGAPRICYQLKHKYIFIHISIQVLNLTFTHGLQPFYGKGTYQVLWAGSCATWKNVSGRANHLNRCVIFQYMPNL